MTPNRQPLGPDLSDCSHPTRGVQETGGSTRHRRLLLFDCWANRRGSRVGGTDPTTSPTARKQPPPNRSHAHAHRGSNKVHNEC